MGCCLAVSRRWSQLCVLLFGLLGACGNESDVTTLLAPEILQSPIINGRPSTPKDYKSVGSLLYVNRDKHGRWQGSMMCTGTLIAPDVVLTAGHCNLELLGVGGPPTSYWFSLSLDVADFGVNGLRLPPETVKVAHVATHPLFSVDVVESTEGTGHTNDIALLYLSQPMDHVPTSELIAPDEVAVLRPGAPVSIVGYGRRSYDPNVREGRVKYQGVTTISRVGHDEMQVGAGGIRPHKCHGDSGGPTYMVIERDGSYRLAIVGVSSHAYDKFGCVNGAVDTRVDRHLDWINREMFRACRSGLRPACRAQY